MGAYKKYNKMVLKLIHRKKHERITRHIFEEQKVMRET